MMSDAVESAICEDRENGYWYVAASRRSPLGFPQIVHPVNLRPDGNVEMKTGSINIPIPSDEYLAIRHGPLRKVGIWSFVPADDPALDDVRMAHRNPEHAGRTINRLRTALEQAERERDEARGLLKRARPIVTWMLDTDPDAVGVVNDIDEHLRDTGD